MKAHIIYRILIDLVIAVSVILGWWYIALPLGVVGLWVFPYYGEFVVASFAFDALYGMGRGLGVVGYLGTIISIAVTGTLYYVKILVRR